MKKTLFDVIRDKANDRKDAVAKHVLKGGCKDYTDYKASVAKIEAFDQMIADTTKLEKSLGNNADD